MALAASACVTTEQELKLVAVAVVVAVGALVVGAALDDVEDAVEEDEPHAVKRMAVGTATMIPTTPRRSFRGGPIKTP